MTSVNCKRCPSVKPANYECMGKNANIEWREVFIEKYQSLRTSLLPEALSIRDAVFLIRDREYSELFG